MAMQVWELIAALSKFPAGAEVAVHHHGTDTGYTIEQVKDYTDEDEDDTGHVDLVIREE